MGPYGEATSVMRIPISLKPTICSYLKLFKGSGGTPLPALEGFSRAAFNSLPLPRPIYSGTIAAGQSRFPSPAQDYELENLDLNKHLISNPTATYYFRVKGDSMMNAGIMDGALAVVNASLKPKSSNIVVAAVDGEWVVKRLYKRGDVVRLLSENPAHSPIEFKEGQELIIFGVVEHVINPIK